MAERAIELRLRNHPGAMAHVTGLFARRGFNVERILCLPEPGGTTSRLLLTVREPARLDQVLLQARRLQDVLEAADAPHGAEVFRRAARLLDGPTPGAVDGAALVVDT